MMDPRALTRAAANKIFFLQRNNAVVFTPTETMGSVTINDDGSDSALWPNRLMFRYKRLGANYLETLTSFFNEYGEFRAAPAQGSTVPFRVFTRETDQHTAHNAGVPLIEAMTDRTTRTRLFAVHNDGSTESIGSATYAGTIRRVVPNGPTLETGYLVLATGAAVPANTPAGTLIFRT